MYPWRPGAPNRPGTGGGGRPGGGGNGGNGGGGGGGGGHRPNGGMKLPDWLLGLGKNPEGQASRDVDLFQRDQLQEIMRQIGMVRDDYGEWGEHTAGLYGSLDRALQGIGDSMGAEFAPVQQAYTQGTQGIIDGLADAGGADDAAAMRGLLGAQMLAGQQLLSSGQERELAWNDSSQRQGGLENMVMQRNIRGDMQDELDNLRDTRMDLFANRDDLTKQRLDELRQLGWERFMSEKEYKLRAAAVAAQAKGQKGLLAYLEDLLGGDLGGGGNRPNDGGNRPNGGGGNNQPGYGPNDNPNLPGGPRTYDEKHDGGGGSGIGGAFRSVLGGDQRLGQLGGGQRRDVLDFARQRRPRVQKAYDKTVGGAGPGGAGGYPSIQAMLRALGRS